MAHRTYHLLKEANHLYIHIPACLKKCKYCDFFSLPTRELSLPELVEAIGVEMRLYQQMGTKLQPLTLYLGGGTPSLLPINLQEKLLSSLSLENAVEITIEINPGTITREETKEFLNLGINRLSIGIQSFLDHELNLLGRLHNSHQNQEILAFCQTQNLNFNIDLIYGLPGQSLEDWKRNLMEALNYSPPHLSLYYLTLEPKTLLWQEVKNGQLRLPSEEEVTQMYHLACELLSSAGYEHYEVSNWAFPGQQSRHNSSYWWGESYLGLGPSAHSFNGLSRWWNHSNLQDYFTALDKNNLPISDHEVLTQEQRLIETIYTRLRTSNGLLGREIPSDYHQNFPTAITKIRQKYADWPDLFHQINQHQITLSEKGLWFHETICEELINFLLKRKS